MGKDEKLAEIAANNETIAENVRKVYDAGIVKGNTDGQALGYDRGYTEGQAAGHSLGYAEGHTAGLDEGKAEGVQSEYDRLWDDYQQNGNRTSYGYAFAGPGWTDATLNPKYPIGTGSGLSINYCFNYASNITRTPLIKAVSWANWTDTFKQATKLQEVNITGTIGRSIAFPHSPILPASMKTVINCLANYKDTTNEGTYSVTFTAACWAALEADSTAPDGGTWKNYVQSKGWTTP